MRIAVAGSGPAGMTASLLLARQGHQVILADRDPGPRADAPWDRVGVMQFHLPHTFRAGARNLLVERLPDVYERLVAAGAVDSGQPGVVDPMALLHARRSLFERELWESATTEPGIDRVTGHIDSVLVDGGATRGLVVDGRSLEAGLVVDATGRAGRLTAPHRPERRDEDSGFAYAARVYQLRDGAEPGPLNGGPGFVAQHDGFLVLIFTHDHGTFTVLLVRLAADSELAVLREEAAFEAALRLLPAAAEWTDPDRAYPIDHVRAGANLRNTYQAQSRTVSDLLVIGDAASTTNPTGARGVALGMQAAGAVADLVREAPREGWTLGLDAWTARTIRPWFEDHLGWDASVRRRWSGLDVDLTAPPSSDLVAAAAATRPDFMRLLGPYLGMLTGPASIDPLREQVSEMLAAGWRPGPVPGVTRDELVAHLRESVPVLV